MKNYTRRAARFKAAEYPRTLLLRTSSGRAFIVRLRHRSRQTDEFLAAAGNFSFADLTRNQDEAWQFASRAKALTAARLALGLRLKDFAFEILPVGSS